MRHHHRWPYILLPLLFCLPTLLAIPSTTKTRHFQKQIHRLVGGHLRIIDPESDDSELITASAGDNSKSKKGHKNDDERKTLSQQVADGKYGLIQKELFLTPPKRPGIISYSANSEVPKDNIATLGGLTKSDIWLAENHLLVIKGGTYPPHDDTKQEYVGQIWQPIDDYNAPLHQVKIPKNPKVPPPFPVQLTDDGPLQILGTNSSRTLNESAETPAYALPPPPGWDGEIPPQNEYFPQTGPFGPNPPNAAPGQAPMRDPVSGEPPGGLPFPPALLNGSLPPYFEHLPPGAAIIPAPIGNETDPGILDEDDPSIYYPPPYSFFYPKDNTSVVPPGPLVPGIILPPPPKFFAALEEDPTTTTTKRPIYTRPTYTTTEPPLSNEITTPKTVPTRVSVVKNYSKVTVRVGPSRKTTAPARTQAQTTKLIKTTIPTTGKPKIITILPVHVGRLNRTYLPAKAAPPVRNKPAVTILRPVKPEVATPKVYLYRNEVRGNNGYGSKGPKPSISQNKYSSPSSDDHTTTFDSQRRPFNRERQRFNKPYISTTQVPLKYHSSSHNEEVKTVTPQPEKFSIGINSQSSKTTTKPATNFYFYEETDPHNNLITTEKPNVKQNPQYYEQPPNLYYNINPPTQAPPPIINQQFQPPVKPQYVYVNGRPYENEKPKFRYVPQQQPRPKPPPNTFSIHVAKLQSQLHQYYTTPRNPVKISAKPVYQYSFEAQNYRPVGDKNFRPSPQLNGNSNDFQPMPKYSVQIQPAIEVIPTQQPSFQQIQPLNAEEPGYFSTEGPHAGVYNQQQYHREIPINEPPKNVPYYTTQRPNNNYNQQYHQEVHKLQGYIQPNLGSDIEISPAKAVAEFSYEATQNPLHQGFYTEPDEGYFDERTRHSFTVFGRKLPTATTPLPTANRHATRLNSNNPGRYRNQPISLQSDININYAKPRPPINPNSEPIPQNQQYYQVNQQEPNPEVIKAIEVTPPSIDEDSKERYIQYQLPGDEGAHFYFLTPQQAERRRQAIFTERQVGRIKREAKK